MMKMRTKLTGLSPMNGNSTNGDRHRGVSNGGDGVGGGESAPENWEMRPSGMLVQKRLDDEQQNIKPPPTIRVRVKYCSVYHDIYINSQATFGELKKMLGGPTGLHHQDMKVYYKDKERDSKEFLDIVGVKDKSKLLLVEDPISQEKRYLEMRKNAKMEKAAKSISEISLIVDRLAGQVTALESVISKGGRVAEKDVVNVIELLMNELIKLDGIVADGDVKLQRKMQVKRVQKYVETLDMLKVKNSMPETNGHAKNSVLSNGNSHAKSNGYNQERSSNSGKPPLPQQRHSIGHSPLKPQPRQEQQQQPSRHSTSGTVVTTQWETFELAPPLIPVSPTSSSGSTTPKKLVNPKFPWDFE
ncbi:BAG family molecular chaperone regulator 3-like [Amaranthus tricolor]|uniref:BAG family molecular chaperone regulator 3-like n=1 Tax=Amaranthus tricolor TaxID=29722 RepID=UPI00258CDFF3|nr:BAG family molecular chaperone regulator 3-like [Amaranthus tricolor]